MTAIRVTTNVSMWRKPRSLGAEDDEDIERGQQDAGQQRDPNRSLKRDAEPITSARSQAAMAISQTIQRKRRDRPGIVSRQAWARSRPVAMPSLGGEGLQKHRHQIAR